MRRLLQALQGDDQFERAKEESRREMEREVEQKRRDGQQQQQQGQKVGLGRSQRCTPHRRVCTRQ